MKLEIKSGVRFGRPTEAMAWILAALLMISRRPSWPATLVITSADDGRHSTGSQHYKGTAIDLRSRSFRPTDAHTFVKVLRQALGPQFTVLYEDEGTANAHFHVQVKKGHQFQPPMVESAGAT